MLDDSVARGPGASDMINTHFHYHLVVLDGVFSRADDGGVRFHASSQLTPAHWLELQRVVQRRVLRYFRTQG
ncbi:MAG: hypothetical protein O2992_14695, partial [Gemmatimonadetes bacterium]|nr:hypothetical protein [Gemmatimonadota bacterium]